MDRYTKEITIDVPGRDFGKVFVLQEMPAMEAFEWTCRAFFAAGRSGMQVPMSALSDAEARGNPGAVFIAMAAFAGQALMGCTFDDAKPLIDQAWTYIKFKPDGEEARPIEKNDIQEVWTIILLKRELLELHLGLSISAEFAKFIGSVSTHKKMALAFASLAEQSAA